jgi:hypothetical protein
MLYINEKIKFIATYLGRREPSDKNNLLYFHIIKNLKDEKLVKYLSNYDEDIKKSNEPQLFVLKESDVKRNVKIQIPGVFIYNTNFKKVKNRNISNFLEEKIGVDNTITILNFLNETHITPSNLITNQQYLLDSYISDKSKGNANDKNECHFIATYLGKRERKNDNKLLYFYVSPLGTSQPIETVKLHLEEADTHSNYENDKPTLIIINKYDMYGENTEFNKKSISHDVNIVVKPLPRRTNGHGGKSKSKSKSKSRKTMKNKK